jgi:hypothetical protein
VPAALPRESPETTAEITWLLLSFLALPLEEQRARVERGAAPRERGALQPEVRNADLFLMSLDVCCSGWVDEFEPCPLSQRLFDMARALPYPPTYEQFLGDPSWHELRALAPHALAEAGLPAWPLAVDVDMEDFVEVPEERYRLRWLAAS